jgi:Papain family cysteine protease
MNAAPGLQVVDCAWDYGVNGCNGGDYEPVFAYVVENGGIALEQVR